MGLIKLTRDRILEKSIAKETGCREWQGYIRKNGYGEIKYEGRMQGAHRISFIAFCGPIPDGMMVCHTCDNRKCVEPSHLFLGTAADNSADMKAKGRQGGAPRKIPQEGRDEIRRLRANGLQYRQIAYMYGVTTMAIFRIVREAANDNAPVSRQKCQIS